TVTRAGAIAALAAGAQQMHDLIPLDPAVPALGMLTEAEVDAMMAYATAEKAAATRAIYNANWRAFSAWAAPASPRRCQPAQAGSPPTSRIWPRPEGAEIAVPRGCRLRPVEAVQAWLAAAGITEGPVFRSVLKGGRVQQGPLPARFVAARS